MRYLELIGSGLHQFRHVKYFVLSPLVVRRGLNFQLLIVESINLEVAKGWKGVCEWVSRAQADAADLQGKHRRIIHLIALHQFVDKCFGDVEFVP